ncbi:MAG TPA: hypothetical protein VFF28_01350 [Candidatus Nanoarchaeia archaeon]|nr:hypothetical protein [Candidatus Nanoarchaeia archaeon]
MIPKSILFYWSKGADVRRKILKILSDCEKQAKPCFLNIAAKKLSLTHVAVKKHIDLMVEEGYIEPINPKGKPVFLKLTPLGKGVIKELEKR